jgi:hypothetical protein
VAHACKAPLIEDYRSADAFIPDNRAVTPLVFVSAAEDEPAVNAGSSLDARLRALEQRIAAIELPEIPRPGSGPQHQRKAAEVIHALSAQIDDLCTQRELNSREAQRWVALAERSVRADDNERAKEALTRHAEHLRLFHEADAQLNEFRALLAEVRRVLSVRPSADPDEDAD